MKHCNVKKVILCLTLVLLLFTATGCCFKHDWTEATCTEPVTCVKCKKTEGEALGHKWQDATCVTPKTCSVCNTTEGDPLGHVWQNATCTEPQICAVCLESQGLPLEHDIQGLTCETDGFCKNCGTVVYAKGHDMLPANKESASVCKECGLLEGEPVTVPWYVDKNAFLVLDEVALSDVGPIVSDATLTLNPDEIEYIINSEGAQILFDDGNRSLLLGDSMLYLCKRDGDQAIIQAALKTSEFLNIDNIYSEGIERAQVYANGVLFTTTDSSRNYSLYYFDWNSTTLYKVSTINTLYPSFDAGYWVCRIDNSDILVIDFADEKAYAGFVCDGWKMNRVTEQGAILYSDNAPLGYLCFENMVGYDTLLEGKVGFVGDDYYIRVNDYSLEKITETATSTWIKKVDDRVLQYDDVSYLTIGNMLYYSSDGGHALVFMGDTADQQANHTKAGLGSYATSTRRYMPVNLSSRTFSDWYILQLGTNNYIHDSEANCSLMLTTSYHISESVDGYLMNRKDDILSGKGYCYRKLKENGYLIYTFSTNSSIAVKVNVSSNPSVDVLK